MASTITVLYSLAPKSLRHIATYLAPPAGEFSASRRVSRSPWLRIAQHTHAPIEATFC